MRNPTLGGIAVAMSPDMKVRGFSVSDVCLEEVTSAALEDRLGGAQLLGSGLAPKSENNCRSPAM